MLHPICETTHYANWAASLPNRRYYGSDSLVLSIIALIQYYTASWVG